jgi:hypothetical protein
MATFYLYATNLEDGYINWNSLGNWWMSYNAETNVYSVPASTLPSSSDDVIIKDQTLSISIGNNGPNIVINNLTIDISSNQYAYLENITITINNTCYLNNTTLSPNTTINGNCVFNGYSIGGGTITGDCVFNHSSHHNGIIYGIALFKDSSYQESSSVVEYIEYTNRTPYPIPGGINGGMLAIA